MPIEYQTDAELGIVHHEFTGEIRYADLERFWRRFLADPSAPDPLVMFADLRDCGLLVEMDEMTRLLRTVIEPLLAGRRWVFAAVVASESGYGAMKQFAVYSQECGVTEAFRDVDQAIEWLLEASAGSGERRASK